MASIEDGVESMVRRAVADLPRVRIGKVVAVNTAGAVDEITVETGARMQTPVSVAVGDSVIWLSGPLPTVIGVPFSSS